MTGSLRLRIGIISVVIGGHFGSGDHFDGGDHFGGDWGVISVAEIISMVGIISVAVQTVWNWSGKTLSPGALLAVLYFSSFHIQIRQCQSLNIFKVLLKTHLFKLAFY